MQEERPSRALIGKAEDECFHGFLDCRGAPLIARPVASGDRNAGFRRDREYQQTRALRHRCGVPNERRASFLQSAHEVRAGREGNLLALRISDECAENRLYVGERQLLQSDQSTKFRNVDDLTLS